MEGASTSPEVAFDSSGNAIAVWHQFDGARFNITQTAFNKRHLLNLALNDKL
jgi:hypothetical protein